MRYLVILILGISFLASCASNANEKAAVTTAPTQSGITPMGDSTSFTSIEWTEPVKSYGKIVEGQKLEVSFAFKNTGDKLLIIEKVSAGCGCTIPEKPEQPFAPGEEGVIKAKFNGSGSVGAPISKNVTVIANTKPVKEHTLIFTGEIVEKK